MPRAYIFQRLSANGAVNVRFPVLGDIELSEHTFSNVSESPIGALDAHLCSEIIPGSLNVGPGPGGEPLKEGYSTVDINC